MRASTKTINPCPIVIPMTVLLPCWSATITAEVRRQASMLDRATCLLTAGLVGLPRAQSPHRASVRTHEASDAGNGGRTSY